MHYPGQFHGFLNCDTVLNAARDALDRIGGALGRALHSGDPAQPRNRTIEIEMLPADEVRKQIPVVSDVLTTTLMVVDWLEYQRNRFLKTLWPAVTVVKRVLVRHQISPLPLYRTNAIVDVAKDMPRCRWLL